MPHSAFCFVDWFGVTGLASFVFCFFRRFVLGHFLLARFVLFGLVSTGFKFFGLVRSVLRLVMEEAGFGELETA